VVCTESIRGVAEVSCSESMSAEASDGVWNYLGKFDMKASNGEPWWILGVFVKW
jgi:hypothetical protein